MHSSRERRCTYTHMHSKPLWRAGAARSVCSSRMLVVDHGSRGDLGVLARRFQCRPGLGDCELVSDGQLMIAETSDQHQHPHPHQHPHHQPTPPLSFCVRPPPRPVCRRPSTGAALTRTPRGRPCPSPSAPIWSHGRMWGCGVSGDWCVLNAPSVSCCLRGLITDRLGTGTR